jgi:hypothetical protein
VGLGPELIPVMSGRRALLGWMLAAFLVTFLLTRAVTHAIRRGHGPFRDTSVGGVHVHHQVYGIFLLLGSGTAEFTYRPGPPAVHVLAVLFGVGAALTLDEFALWLRLDDVYWTPEGRSSIDAVLVALVVGGLLLVGANPLDADPARGEVGVFATVTVNLVFALVAIVKGHVVPGVIGVFLPVLALVAALRLARPGSPWARRRYRPGSDRWRRSHARYPPGRHSRWDAVVDLFAAVPPAEPSGADAGRPARTATCTRRSTVPRVGRVTPDTGAAVRTGGAPVGAVVVAVAALAGALGLVQWAGHERAPYDATGFPAVEAAFGAAGLQVCAAADRPDGLAPQAVASRTYLLARRCPDGPARVVVDRFADAADRDAAARRFESLARPRGSGVVATLGDTTIFVPGSGDDAVQDRLDSALRAAGAR